MTQIIKLGGSVITRDSATSPFDAVNTARLARELAPHAHDTILVHGTGHVGKPFAIDHDYVCSGLIGANRKLLASTINSALHRLNEAVVDTLCRAGIAAYSVDPAIHFDQQMMNFRAADFGPQLKQLLQAGRVPVFFGTLMPLGNGEFRVFSSDRITKILAQNMAPDKVVFLSDVAGVFDRDVNSDPLAQPMPVVARDNLSSMFADESDKHDVSGGMRAKIEYAIDIATHTKRCIVASGVEHGLVTRLLSGDDVVCSEIRP